MQSIRTALLALVAAATVVPPVLADCGFMPQSLVEVQFLGPGVTVANRAGEEFRRQHSGAFESADELDQAFREFLDAKYNAGVFQRVRILRERPLGVEANPDGKGFIWTAGDWSRPGREAEVFLFRAAQPNSTLSDGTIYHLAEPCCDYYPPVTVLCVTKTPGLGRVPKHLEKYAR